MRTARILGDTQNGRNPLSCNRVHAADVIAGSAVGRRFATRHWTLRANYADTWNAVPNESPTPISRNRRSES
jgi:hypothetical protein